MSTISLTLKLRKKYWQYSFVASFTFVLNEVSKPKINFEIILIKIK